MLSITDFICISKTDLLHNLSELLLQNIRVARYFCFSVS